MSYFRPLPLLVLALGLALSACKPTPPVATADADAALATTPAVAGAAPAAAGAECPYADFSVFLARFGNEIALQETSVADPLVKEHYDASAEPEPKLITEQVPLSAVEWPVIPDPATLTRQGRELQVTPQQDGSMQVRIRKPDTGDQQAYTFAQKPCWQLVRMIDESL